MSRYEDGLTERFLIIFAENEKKKTAAVEEAKVFIDNNSNIKTLNNVYHKIFVEHKDVRVYNLSPEAKNILTNYLENNEGLAKLEKNTLKIILNLHVLYHRVSQSLILENDPTPNVINPDTVEMALTLHDFFISTKTSPLLKTSDTDDIMRIILESHGPFITCRRTYMAFPSSRRPSSEDVRQVFKTIDEEGVYGKSIKVGKVLVLYKPIPSEIQEAHLARYRISPNSYKESFDKMDNVLTDAQRDTFTQRHPFRAELDAYNDQ